MGQSEGKVVASSRQGDQREKARKLRKRGSMRAGTKSATSSVVSPELSKVPVTLEALSVCLNIE